MTKPKGQIIARIQPGPVKGTRLVIDEREGALTISITGEPEEISTVPLPVPPKRQP